MKLALVFSKTDVIAANSSVRISLFMVNVLNSVKISYLACLAQLYELKYNIFNFLHAKELFLTKKGSFGYERAFLVYKKH